MFGLYSVQITLNIIMRYLLYIIMHSVELQVKLFSFTGNLENVVGVDDIVKTVEKLTDLEQQDRIKTQNQYLDEIASITGNLYLNTYLAI